MLLYRVTVDPKLLESDYSLEIVGPVPRQGVRRPAEIILFVASPAERAGSAS
jgi:hypothetical protein